MRLVKGRVRNYRSIRDTEWFDVEEGKTILVGPNEAGKTAVLQALQQINPPKGVPKFDPLRDYPRALYNDITSKKVDPASVIVVDAVFVLEADDRKAIPPEFGDCKYGFHRKLDNNAWHELIGGPALPKYENIEKDLTRLAAHVDSRTADGSPKPSAALAAITQGWEANTEIEETRGAALEKWLNSIIPQVNEDNTKEEQRLDRLKAAVQLPLKRKTALDELPKRLPVFVLFNNYFRVRPLIHLGHLATRIETKVLDDSQYDYGNQCLLKLLGFTARELSNLGAAAEPAATDPAALQRYRDQLDKRSYQLNAASVRLTNEIRKVWAPDPDRPEADRLRVVADGQYLKVVVEDDLGVEIELNQRSEGFQWLVSFFVVFFAEAAGKHENTILLLDEPGLSLHGLKQREFRTTISRLAKANQTLYTTHSPFLVGPDELGLVRVVQMTDRNVGTKVHTTVSSGDPAALLPLQEALGYDLAQSLFAQQRNLILEGLTDYWYLDATAELMRDAKIADLNEKIALVPAAGAGKVVYFATILHAHNLKVSALLDSDSAGDQAAQQDTLVNTLGNKSILRTKDAYTGSVSKPEIEDLLRVTLIAIAKDDLGWDVATVASNQPSRPIVDIFATEITNFSKYRLSKAFLRWCRTHSASDLTAEERNSFALLINRINKSLA